MKSARTPKHSAEGAELTELILDVFRLNGRLLAAGDALVAELGLTSSRWQVLGAIVLSSTPQPVANLARDMGLTRQAVQRVVNELETEGIVSFADNPHHLRAKLIAVTKRGAAAYAAAAARQAPWANSLAKGIPTRDLKIARTVARILVEKLSAGTRATRVAKRSVHVR